MEKFLAILILFILTTLPAIIVIFYVIKVKSKNKLTKSIFAYYLCFVVFNGLVYLFNCRISLLTFTSFEALEKQFQVLNSINRVKDWLLLLPLIWITNVLYRKYKKEKVS